MKTIKLPFGTQRLSCTVSEECLRGVLESPLHSYRSALGEAELVEQALQHPIGSKSLAELAKGRNKVVLIASDHTRPVPSKLLIPPMLREIRRGNPKADITILVATGCHRDMTEEEKLYKFGPQIVENEKIVIHDCDDRGNLIDLGVLPSGGVLLLNRLAVEADLLVSEGFIEPHFFAGFSGGRKSVLPGIAGRKTVVANHCAAFIDDPHARTGILEGNPIHRDMLYAAKCCGLAFILNVVLNSEKKIIYAVAGDCEKAHRAGVEFLSGLCGVQAAPADLVVSTNGGYPLDQNIYQAVKGMTAAEATVKNGGVILMLSKSNDGHGGEVFYDTFANEKSLDSMMARFRATPAEETIPDQWQSQIFARILQRATVLYLSDAPDEMVRGLHMIPIHSIEEGFEKAKELLNNQKPSITVIPDGVSVIVAKQEDMQ